MTFLGARLKMLFDTLETNNGKNVYASKSYSDVRNGLEQAQLIEIVNVLAGLTDYDLQNAELITTQFVC